MFGWFLIFGSLRSCHLNIYEERPFVAKTGNIFSFIILINIVDVTLGYKISLVSNNLLRAKLKEMIQYSPLLLLIKKDKGNLKLLIQRKRNIFET